MGITVLDFPIDQSFRTDTGGAHKIPIAVGENYVFLLKQEPQPRVVRIDLQNQTTTLSNSFATEFGYSSGAIIFPYDTGKKRNGDIFIDCFVHDLSEAAGSRNLYIRRFTIDPTDLTLGAGTQRTLTGSADLEQLTGWWRFARFGETIITTVRKTDNQTNANYAIKIDLHAQRYSTVKMEAGDPYDDAQRFLCSLLTDRTTDTLYYLVYLYKTWIPGSGVRMGIYNVDTLDVVATTFDYESGCGGICALHYYRDTTGKVRYYHIGNSGAESYTTHFGTFYADDGSLIVESERVIDDSYKDYSSGNSTPIALGTTTDNKIAWLLIGGGTGNNTAPSTSHTQGFQLIKTDDTFGNPTKVTLAATYNVTTSDLRIGHTRSTVFLWESDWCYYAPNTILASSPNDVWKIGKLDLSDTGVTLTEDNPYNLMIVPTSGIVPTTLTLTITKV